VYRIRNTRCRPVLDRTTVCHEPRPLDVDAMAAAAAFLTGRHDFFSFMAAGSTAKTTVRTLYDIRVCRDPGDPVIAIHVTGDGFLYNMVRILSGTLLYAGLGKILPEDLPGILAARDRRQAGKTLPARGLTLEAVFYPMNGRIETLDGELFPPAWTDGEVHSLPKGETDGA
jgi:tRNA pseudouridine38-40 synthase